MAQDLEWAAERFALLARYLKDAGEGGLSRELGRAITDATGPALGDVRKALPDHLPDPYAKVLGDDLRLATSRLTGPNPGVRIRGTTPGTRRRLKRLEDGVLAHPLFGNRRHWYDQTSHVRPGWFSEPLDNSVPKVREAINAAVNDVERKITEGR